MVNWLARWRHSAELQGSILRPDFPVWSLHTSMRLLPKGSRDRLQHAGATMLRGNRIGSWMDRFRIESSVRVFSNECLTRRHIFFPFRDMFLNCHHVIRIQSPVWSDELLRPKHLRTLQTNRQRHPNPDDGENTGARKGFLQELS